MAISTACLGLGVNSVDPLAHPDTYSSGRCPLPSTCAVGIVDGNPELTFLTVPLRPYCRKTDVRKAGKSDVQEESNAWDVLLACTDRSTPPSAFLVRWAHIKTTSHQATAKRVRRS